MYVIEDYYVFGVTSKLGEKGHHYSIEVKELSDEQINKLIDLAYGESTYIEPNSLINSWFVTDFYVTIEYDGQIKKYYIDDFQY